MSINPDYRHKFPWQFRIMGRMGEQPPVEFYRSHERFQMQYWDFQTRDLDPSWQCWVERHTDPSRLISPRPIP